MHLNSDGRFDFVDGIATHTHPRSKQTHILIMPKIFISYKRVDKERVFNLKNQIEAGVGVKCWVDVDGIESDAQFKNVIINAIKQCEIFLFMYSKAHSEIIDFEKDWTIRELNFASAKNKRIVFINLDGSPLTDEFSFDYGLKQQVDGQSSEAINRLISDLRKWLKPIEFKEISRTQSNTFDIPQDSGCTIMVQDGDSIIERIYSNGQEVSNRKIEKRSDDDNNDKRTINLNFIGKKKGCVVAVSVVAAVCLLLIPAFWTFKSPDYISDTYSYSDSFEQTSDDSKAGISENERLTGIDLGLPSGTLWANMNVGADSPSGFGKLFSWYDCKSKSLYARYSYVKETNNQTLNGRHHEDHTIFIVEWQAPSVDDFKELIDNCHWIWTSLNGHNGYEIWGKNGNSIFLPASSSFDNIEQMNEYGYYWTSDEVDDKYVKILLFNSYEKKIEDGCTDDAYSIRAVSKPIIPVAE